MIVMLLNCPPGAGGRREEALPQPSLPIDAPQDSALRVTRDISIHV